jgi:hypothetical protein
MYGALGKMIIVLYEPLHCCDRVFHILGSAARAHRRKRPRKPCIRMMLHQNGSRHAWLRASPSST